MSEKLERNIPSYRIEKKESLILKSITKLENYFPKAFNLKSPKPLKEGVQENLLEMIKQDKIQFFNRELRRALKYYVRSEQYIKSFKTNSHQIDLQGDNFREITDKDIEYSNDILTNRPQMTFKVLKSEIPFRLPKRLKRKYEDKMNKWTKQKKEVIEKIHLLAEKDPKSLTSVDLNRFKQLRKRIETLDNNLKITPQEYLKLNKVKQG